jgi:hypothetical protein
MLRLVCESRLAENVTGEDSGVCVCVCVYQWRLLRGERLIIMSGTGQMEWHQTPVNNMFDVFDTIPLIALQSLPRVHSPQLKCQQCPVVCMHVCVIVRACVRACVW